VVIDVDSYVVLHAFNPGVAQFYMDLIRPTLKLVIFIWNIPQAFSKTSLNFIWKCLRDHFFFSQFLYGRDQRSLGVFGGPGCLHSVVCRYMGLITISQVRFFAIACLILYSIHIRIAWGRIGSSVIDKLIFFHLRTLQVVAYKHSPVRSHWGKLPLHPSVVFWGFYLAWLTG